MSLKLYTNALAIPIPIIIKYNFLAENGIIGLSFLLFFYFFTVFIFLSRIYNDFFIERRNIYFNKTILLCIILIIIWFPFVPHMSFYNNWYNVMLMLIIGFLLKELYG